MSQRAVPAVHGVEIVRVRVPEGRAAHGNAPIGAWCVFVGSAELVYARELFD